MLELALTPEGIEIAARLGLALLIGSLIGLERTFSGRPAGFRTHALVCVASAMLMLVTSYQHLWLGMLPLETVRTDPTRMAQGIMTGIGFLGAGVIFKEGVTIRGLTTAASIWMTAAIGTLVGIGFHYPALFAAVITLGVLSLFRLIETRFPTRHFAHHVLRFERNRIMTDAEVRQMLRSHHFSIVKMHYQLRNDGDAFEYRMVIKTIDKRNMESLCAHLLTVSAVQEFQLGALAD